MHQENMDLHQKLAAMRQENYELFQKVPKKMSIHYHLYVLNMLLMKMQIFYAGIPVERCRNEREC
jgi:hypothetical protein